MSSRLAQKSRTMLFDLGERSRSTKQHFIQGNVQPVSPCPALTSRMCSACFSLSSAYLEDVLSERSRSSDEEKSAAVNRLLAVHSTSGTAVSAVEDYMTRLGEASKEDPSAGDLRGRIIEENKGFASEVPQLYKRSNLSTAQGIDSRQLNNLKSGAIEQLLEDEAAGQQIIQTQLEALNSQSQRGNVKDSVLIQMNASKNPAHKEALAAAGIEFGTVTEEGDDGETTTRTVVTYKPPAGEVKGVGGASSGSGASTTST